MSARKAKTPLMRVLDMTLAGCAEDVDPATAADAIREHEDLMADLIEARGKRDKLRDALAEGLRYLHVNDRTGHLTVDPEIIPWLMDARAALAGGVE